MCPPIDHHNFKEVVVEALPKARIEVRNFYLNVFPHPHNHPRVHPLVLNSIRKLEVDSPLGGRLKHFIAQWERITNDVEVLNIVKGWEIPFLETPSQSHITKIHMSTGEKQIINLEIEELINKGAIRKTHPIQGQFISSLFLREKKDGSQRPILNLKNLNKYIPYIHFKMENLKNVKNIIKVNDWMVKLDLKDAYFTLPLSQKSWKYVRFLWEEDIYQFLCLCFGLGPAPRLFTKLMKVPISMLRRLNIRLIIFLDDLLIFGSSMQEILEARDTIIYLLQNLGFVINWKKSTTKPSKVMEYLGIIIDSTQMSMSLTEEKIKSLTTLCQMTLTSKKLSLRKLSSLIGKLTATAAAVTPCLLQIRFLQQLQIRSMKKSTSFETLVHLDNNSKMELSWWIENLKLRTGKPILTAPPDLIICSDAAKTGGWGAECRGTQTGGQWTREEKNLHINQQEMIAADLAVRTFSKLHPSAKSIHLKIDNITALAYIMKMGGTKNTDLIKRSKSLWEYLLSWQITLTAEYLPSILNVEADYQSRNVQDWSEWKLCPQTFKMICKHLGNPNMDLFASRTSHQILPYMSLKLDPMCHAVDAFQQNWAHMFPYAFPPFNLIGRVLKKAQNHQIDMIIITPIWVTQPWYPTLLGMSILPPLLIPMYTRVLQDPAGTVHPLIQNRTLQLGAWLVSGKTWKIKHFQQGLQTLLQVPDQQGHDLITTQPGRNSVAGVVNRKLIQFNVT